MSWPAEKQRELAARRREQLAAAAIEIRKRRARDKRTLELIDEELAYMLDALTEEDRNA